ncbi:hypothetical protein R3W88_024479 [Solanum pinnatisectum]|uniref:Aminotransferase-like plant mobile domain-containing protein n=1 Tax=Solanum pinnatisectum TaxID=50273 RepID=A0AAV9M0R8_9SOLN|nr:hypothetical protein R3W88_024479 [Solanum pinnatisectum]
MVFSNLGAKHQKYETYLTAFLSCWLCAFVFLFEKGNFIRLGTFKIASLMASGRRVSLVPVLASIYHGINKISNSSQLDHIRVCFPIHYVYCYLAYYLKTHYPLTSGPSLPRMVVYSGEVVHTSTDKEKCPQFLFSSKRALQETSKTSKDLCWKRQRVEPSGAEVVYLRVVEVQSVDSPSRSMTIQSDKVFFLFFFFFFFFE